jgi:hypothetical protein
MQSIAPCFNSIFDQLEEGGQKEGIEGGGAPKTHTRTLDSSSNLSLKDPQNSDVDENHPLQEEEDREILAGDKKKKRSMQRGRGTRQTSPSASSAKRAKFFNPLPINLKQADLKTCPALGFETDGIGRNLSPMVCAVGPCCSKMVA